MSPRPSSGRPRVDCANFKRPPPPSLYQTTVDPNSTIASIDQEHMESPLQTTHAGMGTWQTL